MNTSKIVYTGEDGKLVYVADERGNIVPDFSNCGYRGGGVKLPDVPVRATVMPGEGDDGVRIQGAVDHVSKMPPDESGFRGAVLLKKGRYEIAGKIILSTSGVVLRGEGRGEDGTVLIATGKEQRALIEVQGRGGVEEAANTAQKILDDYVPVGARSFRLASAKDLRVGDAIVVRRHGNKEWIHEIGMDRIEPYKGDEAFASHIQWKPFHHDFDRMITKIEGNRLTIDAPITAAIEMRWGGGTVFKATDSGRIHHIGIEHLRGVSEFDESVKTPYRRRGRGPAVADSSYAEFYISVMEKGRSGEGEHFSDEDHCGTLISIHQAKNVWVRKVHARHFIFACVTMGKDSKWVTVQDCSCVDMVGLIWGSRRYPFLIAGQLSLVQRCYAETGRHDFAFSGQAVCGPNVFLFCTAEQSYDKSEPHMRWSVGGLYDNVRAPISIMDRYHWGNARSAHGWSGANFVVWNCEGSLVCQKSPTAQNYAIGQVGVKSPGRFTPREDGYWESHGRHVSPKSLYLKQLEDRLGAEAVGNIEK